MTASFDPEGLWIKSCLFVNRALDPDREFEEQAFWACCALELLGKSALARVSPLLIANPVDNGDSLLVASGLTEGRVTSVQAKTVWSRCQRAFRPFDEAEAKKISLGRNEYIHAAGVGFDTIPSHAWWPRYWSQVVILLGHMGLVVEDYVAGSHVDQVTQALAAHRNAVKHELEARVERAKTMLNQSRAGTLSPRQQREWDAQSFAIAKYHTYVECPACSGEATLYGEEVIEADVHYEREDWDEYSVQVTLTIAPMALHCDVCRLELWDNNLLIEAELDEGFDVEGSGDDIQYEPEYNNE